MTRNKNPVRRNRSTVQKSQYKPRAKTIPNPYAMEVFAKGYGDAGASLTKTVYKGETSSSGSAHEDIEFNLYKMRERSRTLFQSSSNAAAILLTYRTNVIGSGLRLQARVDKDVLGWSPEKAREWEKQVEREFALWAESAENCDSTGMETLYEMMQSAFISYLMSGDAFIIREEGKENLKNPYRLRLHLLEGDRCSSPGMVGISGVTTIRGENGNLIYNGVEVNGSGRVIAYHFSPHHPFEMAPGTELTGDWKRIPVRTRRLGTRNVLHLMVRERPEQYRGVPLLAKCIEELKQLERFTQAELTAAVVQSMHTYFITTESPSWAFPFAQTMEDAPEQTESEYSIGPGTINVLKPGEKVEPAMPTRPSGSYEPYIKANLSQITAGCELPMEVVLKQHNSSYTAARANNLEAWKAFKMQRAWFVEDFCRPVYEMFLTEAIINERIDAPGFFDDPLIRKAYLGSEWIGPSMGMLNPKDELEASALAIQMGISTSEAETMAANGGDWYGNMSDIRREREVANELPLDPQTTRTIQYDGQGGEMNEPVQTGSE